jgi:hypothetical protein
MANPLKSSRSPDERAAAGKASRADALRARHGDWAPASDRQNKRD